VTLDDIAAWHIGHGPLELKTTSTRGALNFDFVTAREPRNNYVAARTSIDWTLPAKARIELDARSRARFAVYCALGLTAADGRTFNAVLSADPRKGHTFTPSVETASVALSRFRSQDGTAPEPGLRIKELTLSFGLEAGVTNAVTLSRLQLLAGETPPLDNPAIIVNPDQNWTFAFNKDSLDLTPGFDKDGLCLAFKTRPAPANNYLAATLRHAWTLPESGRINVHVKAAAKRAHYFALALTTDDGRKLNGVFGGDPKRGFAFPADVTIATLDTTQLKASDEKPVPAGTRIVAVTLSFGFEPGVANTLHISRLDLVANETD
jgi:hypothetical protein